jgi:hypothetical protein
MEIHILKSKLWNGQYALTRKNKTQSTIKFELNTTDCKLYQDISSTINDISIFCKIRHRLERIHAIKIKSPSTSIRLIPGLLEVTKMEVTPRFLSVNGLLVELDDIQITITYDI